jgi:hypothetical protein
MKKVFPFIKIPSELLDRLGEPDPGTRLYRKIGTEADTEAWFQAVFEVCEEGGGTISPGGVTRYVKVSRPAVHKRLKEGRLTGFLFHRVEDRRFLKGQKLVEGGHPYILIPVSECRAWGDELRDRRELAKEEMSIPPTTTKHDAVLKPPPDWKKRIKKD